MYCNGTKDICGWCWPQSKGSGAFEGSGIKKAGRAEN